MTLTSIYLRSTLAGLVASLVVGLLFLLAVAFVMGVPYMSRAEMPAWILSAVTFAWVFLWQRRRSQNA